MVQLVQIAILGSFEGEKAQKPQKHLDETDTLIRVLTAFVIILLVSELPVRIVTNAVILYKDPVSSRQKHRFR